MGRITTLIAALAALFGASATQAAPIEYGFSGFGSPPNDALLGNGFFTGTFSYDPATGTIHNVAFNFNGIIATLPGLFIETTEPYLQLVALASMLIFEPPNIADCGNRLYACDAAGILIDQFGLFFPNLGPGPTPETLGTLADFGLGFFQFSLGAGTEPPLVPGGPINADWPFGTADATMQFEGGIDSFAPIAEPGSIVLFVTSMVGLALRRKRGFRTCDYARGRPDCS